MGTISSTSFHTAYGPAVLTIYHSRHNFHAVDPSYSINNLLQAARAIIVVVGVIVLHR
jgi:hypothetical protein